MADPSDASRAPRLDVLSELALALLGVHVLLLALFGSSLSVRSPNLSLLAALVLLGLRAFRNRKRPSEKLAWRTRIRPGNWLAGFGAPGFILAFCFLFVFFLFYHHGGRLGGDGVINYIYVRSLVIDGDLDLTNEFEDFVPDKFQFIAERGRQFDRAPDPSHEPGPALLWTPAFLVTHGLVKFLGWMGSEIPADGYSYPYINAVSVMSLIWSLVAVVVTYRVCRRYFEARLAAVSISVLWLSSTLLWYSVRAPTMSHATTAAVVSLFLYLWLEAREAPSAWRWIAVGLAGGLVFSMQRYNIFYLIAPLVTATGWTIRALARKKWRPSRKQILTAGLVVAAFLLTALPMLLYNFYYSVEGSFLRSGDLSNFAFRYWKDPRIAEFLFSSNHGLFSWTPAAYLAVAGLFLFFRKDGRLAATLLLTLAGGIYLLSGTWDWYAGNAFGSRRLTEGFLIFALGFCAATEFLLGRPKVLLTGGLGALVVWNFMLAQQVVRGEVPEMGTFSFADVASRAAQRFYSAVGHPAAIPAAWFFSYRYGVSPAQFDLTYAHRSYHNALIDVGSARDRFFLGRGWSVRETEPDGRSYRWSTGQESTWLIPLFGPLDYRLSLTGEASRHPEGWKQSMVVEINGRRASRLTLGTGWQTKDLRVDADFWKEGLNEIRLTYGWTVEAGQAYESTDRRQIAYRLSELELQIIK